MQTPTATLINTGFRTDAQSASGLKGMPGLRSVAETVACECSVLREINDGINQVMNDVVAALTKPLSAREQDTRPPQRETARIVISGDLSEVNRFFYRRGWSDGLPLVPPTEAAVAEMLQGTDLPPGHLVAKLEPRFGHATVEKIAVNAVMAGALPIHLPVIIAIVEGLADKNAGFGTYGCSTGSWAPFTLVNGPVRDVIQLNYGSGALSPGNIANAAIGRAVSLIAKNIAGARKGVEDMGVLGNPAKYSQVLAEDEAGNPWEPEHVTRGYAPGESAITLFFPNSYNQLWPYGTDAQGILSALVFNMMPARSGALTLFILPSTHAQTLARAGWNKDSIKAHIAAKAMIPAHKHPSFHGSSLAASNREHDLRDPAELVPLMRNPECMRIVVAGGPGSFMGVLTSSGLLGDFVTKPIRLPAEWDTLVKKYKNLTPKYEIFAAG